MPRYKIGGMIRVKSTWYIIDEIDDNLLLVSDGDGEEFEFWYKDVAEYREP